MTPLLAAVLGALAGLAIGWALAAVVGRRDEPAPTASVAAPPGLTDIVHALRCAAAVVGPADEIVVTNAAAFSLGVVRGTRIGIPALLDLIRTVRSEGESAAVNLTHERAPGRADLQLAVRVVPLPGRLLFVVADDRVPELRMQESTRDFIANSTHELKTPIGAIALLGEAMEQAADDPDAVVRFARKTQREASRLDTLVSQIITLSRLQGDPVRLSGEVDVDALVGRAIDAERELAERRGISLVAAPPSGLVARGDTERLLAALANLLDNAINHSDARGRVVVTARSEERADGPHVAIAVSDNGIGIEPDDQQRIFERFYRVDHGRSRATGGTGLGLAIVDEIVHGHGGEVTVWSKPGAGSTFTMVLPAAGREEDA